MDAPSGPQPTSGFLRAVRANVTRRPLAAYLVLAYAVSWGWWWPLSVAAEPVRAGTGWPTHLPGLLGPAIAAAVVTALTEGRSGLARLGARCARVTVGGWWWAVVALAAVGGGAAVVTGTQERVGAELASWTAYPGVPAGWGPWLGMALVLLVNGVGEEAGWRGFAVERLAARRSLLTTAVWVAAAWGVWHLPLFFVLASFREFGVGGVIGWATGLTAGSIVLAWLYLRGGRSVLLVAVWHTLFNYTSATPAAGGAMAAASSAAVMIAAAAIVVLERRPRRSR